MTVTLPRDEARRRLVSWLALASPWGGSGPDGVRSLLTRLRHIQLDPLDAIGTNADLVAMARIADCCKGDVYRYLGPNQVAVSASFEHFAKVRCILPGAFFPWYREHMPGVVSWWNDGGEERLGPGVLEAVLDEVREIGPVTPSELADHGHAKRRGWHGWTDTGRAAKVALDVLWARCQVVVSGKNHRGHRLYDVPERALPQHAGEPAGPWGEWAVAHRAAAAGLLPKNAGPWWTTLKKERKDGTLEAMKSRGDLVAVRVDGDRREYLAPAAFLEAPIEPADDALRILGPLDPILWDRKLVAHAFGFEYIWEVYKPAKKRTWGWYVCPLLHSGELVGRIEARAKGDALTVQNVWWEDGRERPAALKRALESHARRCGATVVDGL